MRTYKVSAQDNSCTAIHVHSTRHHEFPDIFQSTGVNVTALGRGVWMEGEGMNANSKLRWGRNAQSLVFFTTIAILAGILFLVAHRPLLCA